MIVIIIVFMVIGYFLVIVLYNVLQVEQSFKKWLKMKTRLKMVRYRATSAILRLFQEYS